MKTLLLFGSTHHSTRRVVEKLPEYLHFPYDVVDTKTLPADFSIAPYDLLLFFAPTYGDEELQDDVENFLVRTKAPLQGKHYAICELGNYYGYDDFSYGAMQIIKSELDALGASQFVPPVSVDALPKKDWECLKQWCNLLNQEVNKAS